MEFHTEGRVQEVLLHMSEPLKKAVLTFIFYYELPAWQPSDCTSLMWNMGLLDKWKDISKQYERVTLGLDTLCVCLFDIFMYSLCQVIYLFYLKIKNKMSYKMLLYIIEGISKNKKKSYTHMAHTVIQ
jgi:hypothetical protein